MWPLLRNVASFTLGAFILTWQTVWEQEAQAVLVGAALALIGVPAVDIITRKISS